MYKVSKKNAKEATKQEPTSKKEATAAGCTLQDNRPEAKSKQKTQHLIANYTPPNTPFQRKVSSHNLNSASTTSVSLQHTHETTQKEVVQGAFKYASAIHLEPITKVGTVRASNLKIEEIVLPEGGRPSTKYKKKQKSHSISWTLLTRAYASVKNMPLDVFIKNYLITDWEELRKQKVFMSPNIEAYKKLNFYLDKYSQNKLQSLVTNPETPTDFQQKITEAVSNYFAALQLAPLTTHTKHKSDDHVARHGGESSSNKILPDIEKELGKNDKAPNYKKQIIIEKLKAYWDPGTGGKYGINDPKAVALLGEKLQNAIKRSFPRIWNLYKNMIDRDIIGPDITKATKFNNKYKKKKNNNNNNSTSETDTIDPTPEAFYAQIHMSPQNTTNNNFKKFTARDVSIKKLLLSNARPPTKYGNKQKSHTVAWILTLQAIQNSATNKTLMSFIDQMISHWELLKAQNWDKMINSNNHEIRNKEHLEDLNDKIETSLTELREAKSAHESSLEWTDFIQKNISNYITVYAAAPLTTRKGGIPKNRGEHGANNFFKQLEVEPNTIKWSERFKKEFIDKKYNEKNNKYTDRIIHFKGDNEEVKDIKKKKLHKKLTQGTKKVVNKENLDRVKKVTIRQMALKYADFKWDRATGPEMAKKRVKNRAMIQYEWENSMRNAYPKVWKEYKHIFIEASDKKQVSDTIHKHLASSKEEDNKNDDKKTSDSIDNRLISSDKDTFDSDSDIEMINNNNNNNNVDISQDSDSDSESVISSSEEFIDERTKKKKKPQTNNINISKWMQPYHYQLGLKDARNGDFSMSKFPSFNKALQEYKDGLELARQNKPFPTSHNKGKAYKAGYDEYMEGVNTAKETPQIKRTQGYYAFLQGYNDHQNTRTQNNNNNTHTSKKLSATKRNLSTLIEDDSNDNSNTTTGFEPPNKKQRLNPKKTGTSSDKKKDSKS
ncbi:MAG: hypothetical protein AAF611_20410 [Bacteroidota bacterium]